MDPTPKLSDSLGVTSPLTPPLYQSSVYTIPDLDAIDRIYSGEAPGFIYARDAHPNARRLAELLAAEEQARGASSPAPAWRPSVPSSCPRSSRPARRRQQSPLWPDHATILARADAASA